MTQSLSDWLVVSDMDTVLLDAKGGIPEVNRNVIRLFCARGGRFTVVTNRTAESVRTALSGLPLSGPAVCSGGSVVYDFAQEKCLERCALNRAQAEEAIGDARKRFPAAGLEIETGSGDIRVVRANAFTDAQLRREKLPCILEQLEDVPEPWGRAVFAAEPSYIDMLQGYGDAAPHGTEIDLVRTGPSCYEILPAHISKASGLKALAEYYDVPLKHILMIGGWHDDLECMAAAGYSAATADAPGRVKLAADTVTVTGCEDGALGEFLYGWMRRYEK
jgi:hydroxymethylpyrimidine pyrophosphatase-like HAD family hydrolase